MSLLSIVVPCFNEERALPLFADELSNSLRKLREVDPDACFEVVFIDDGSDDGTLDEVKALASPTSPLGAADVRWISFSRNFGKEAALYAGLKEAKGDFVVTMDADLQDPPSLLPEMYRAVREESYDSAATRRVDRKGEPPIRSFFAHRFYGLMKRISKVDVVDGARDYRLMSRIMVDAVVSMGEYNRFSKGIYGWVGFKTKWFPYENTQRAAGETKWSFRSLFLYSLSGIIDYSAVPLSVASGAGLILCLAALAGIVFIIVRTLAFGDPVAGWPSLACLTLFIGGLQLLCLGIMGQYIARNYLESKHRPLYIVRESSAGTSSSGTAS